jgi:16S rRNA (guanine1207-N2)-methyltransferase
MEHYYTENPNTPHSLRKTRYTIHNIELEFITDAGVFSKSHVDFGSDILIKSLPPIPGQVLDLGCGYGPIGISIAKLNPSATVTMVDINNRAVDLANQNIALNGLHNARAIQSDGFNEISNYIYDVIVTNPPIRAGKKIIYALFEKSIEHLCKGGCFYIVIQKKQGAKSAMDKLQSIYGNCEAIEKKGGYWVLKSIKNQ